MAQRETEVRQSRESRGKLATTQQRKASNPEKSVWVQASAGTGKTKVLSDRVLRILLNGCPPGRILCLTYTKAAAVEMSQRISARLSAWAVTDTQKLDEELENLFGGLPANQEDLAELEATARRLFAVLLDTPGGMKIQTIHSFCQEILKRFPLEAHISPYFEVMDDRAAAEALGEIRRQLLAEIEHNPHSRAAEAMSFLTGKVSEFSFPKILTAIAESRNKIARMFSRYQTPEAVVAELARRSGIVPESTEGGLLAEFAAAADWATLQKLAEAWRQGGESDNTKAEKLFRILETRDIAGGFDDYQSCFLNKDGALPARPGTKDAVAFYPDLPEVCLVEGERLQQLSKQLAAVRLLAATKAVLFLAEDLISGYNRFKAQHAKLDYEDLIVLTRRLLDSPQVPQWVMFKLDGGIDNILIDEAQDTSPDQWAIVKALTAGFFDDTGAGGRRRTVFAVGDKKQSIYSFQGAEPKEFERMRGYFAAMLEECGAFDEINLEVSFRSASAVLDMVNTVFSEPAVKPGVAGENEDITHIPFRIGDAGKIEFWPLTEPEEGENPDIWLPPVERVSAESTSSRLAREIAQRIREMVESGESLASQGRPLRYRDFMILVQRRNSFVEELVRACKNAGVTIAGVDKIKLSEQIAVQDLISLGRFLLLPGDDLSLAEVLKSPLFGLDDDDLFALCYGRNPGTTVWSRLASNRKYADVYALLQELCNLAEKVRPFELYSHVLGKLKGRQKFVARLGAEAEDGLDEFVNLTLSFEQEHIPDLQGFIDWMSKDDVEIKRELEQSDADAVRVMTVHGSKGLQAPVVILPDTVRVPAVKNESAMLWDDIFYYPLSSKDYVDNCKKIKENEKTAALEEYRRLLYVALTRAEDRLCICGYYKSQRSRPSDESWYGICAGVLKQIGREADGGKIEYSSPQLIVPKAKKTVTAANVSRPDFDWIYREAPQESVLARPLAPSKMDDEEPALVSPLGSDGGSRYRRGLIIHKLLQFLPEVQDRNKSEIVAEFLEKNAPELSAGEKQRICREVLALIENPVFAPLFSEHSKAEVPIMGLSGGRIVSGQVDRLAVVGDEVMVVDYKTNRPAAAALKDVPAAYLRQLAAYRDLLSRVYPGKKVSTFILWTDTANLMQVE